MTCVRALFLAATILACACLQLPGSGQTPDPPPDDLRLVIILSRHGVRTPIASETRGNHYNAEPWPAWPVPPGVLTPHGVTLLQQMGGYYRLHYRSLLGTSGCSAIFAYADQQQRTIASAQAVLAGLAPGCNSPVQTIHGSSAPSLPERGAAQKDLDPLFNADAFSDIADRARLAAAITGQVGGDPVRLSSAWHAQLVEMENILRGPAPPAGLRSLPSGTSSIAPDTGSELVSIQSPVATAADFAENLLLQYAEGLPQVGWGRVDRATLDRLMALNTAYHSLILETPDFAHIGASDMAAHIDATLRQAVSGAPVKGAFGSPSTHLVLLMGHDSNLTWMAGLLHLHWLLPEGAQDATPPGSALVFELYRSGDSYSVRTRVVSQTLDQMRHAVVLTDAAARNPHAPEIAPVFVPGCSTAAAGYSCTAAAFHEALNRAIDPRFVR